MSRWYVIWNKGCKTSLIGMQSRSIDQMVWDGEVAEESDNEQLGEEDREPLESSDYSVRWFLMPGLQ